MSRLFATSALFLLVFSCTTAAPVPPELDTALKQFRADGAAGWAFIQSTESGGKSLVEHYDPAKPDFARWTLLKKNGGAPSPSELQEYRERLSRRSGNGTAPNVKDRLDRTSCELVREDAERAHYRFRLVPGGNGDRSAAHMVATFVLHRPTATIERVELASFEPFSPVFAVRIAEARTTMEYSLPAGNRPALLQRIAVRIRGRAMWFKSLDEDMTVTYSEHEYTGRKPAPHPSP